MYKAIKKKCEHCKKLYYGNPNSKYCILCRRILSNYEFSEIYIGKYETISVKHVIMYYKFLQKENKS